MKFNNIRVFNFQGALRGMRNPKNSWNKSDSSFGFIDATFAEDIDDKGINLAVSNRLYKAAGYKFIEV